MKTHHQLTDATFEKQFANCELSPSLFNHEAHLRLAWMYINKYGIEEALHKVQSQLLNFVTHVGATDKYNKTLTIAAVKTVYHFTLKSKAATFQHFMLEFPRLQNNFKDLLAAHYSFDVFTLEAAKKSYIAPDILPYDC